MEGLREKRGRFVLLALEMVPVFFQLKRTIMHLLQFYALTEHQEFHQLLLQGVCIAQRKIADKPVLLFQLGRSYTEIFFSPDSLRVLHSTSFQDTDRLKPYLSQIDLSDVLPPGKL